MAGYVYMNDLAEMGQSASDKAAQLEAAAVALEKSAAALEAQATARSIAKPAQAANLRQQAANQRASAADQRKQAAALNSSSTSGGVSGKDALDVLKTLFSAGAQVGTAVLNKNGMAVSGNPGAPGLVVVEEKKGLGTWGTVGLVAAAAVATGVVVSKIAAKPVKANRRRRRR